MSKAIVITENEFNAIVSSHEYMRATLQSKGHTLISTVQDASMKIRDVQGRLNTTDLDSITSAISEDLAGLVIEIKEILEDKKVNLRDLGDGWQATQKLISIVRKLPEIQKELSDLDDYEWQLLGALLAQEITKYTNKGDGNA